MPNQTGKPRHKLSKTTMCVKNSRDSGSVSVQSVEVLHYH